MIYYCAVCSTICFKKAFKKCFLCFQTYCLLPWHTERFFTLLVAYRIAYKSLNVRSFFSWMVGTRRWCNEHKWILRAYHQKESSVWCLSALLKVFTCTSDFELIKKVRNFSRCEYSQKVSNFSRISMLLHFIQSL